MKTDVRNLVSLFNLKKNYFFLLLIISLFSFVNQSYKEESSPTTPRQNKILTDATIAKLQAAADKIMRNYNTPGLAAYINVNGEGELTITRGVGNLATSEAMNANNSFRIGSITKTFTTEAVLILVDEGKIDLNKTISFYLPELNIPGSDKITMRMLGNMTSGLADYTQDPDLMTAFFNSKGELILSPEYLVATASKYPLSFEPGTKYEYCNTNTIVLGLVISKVTGKQVGQVLAEKIFQPLGMANTFWPNTRYLPFPYSHGYSSDLTGTLAEVTNWSPSLANAAGILVSNIPELRIWIKEVTKRNLLSDKMKAERINWIDAETPGSSYYAFGIEKLNGWIGHSGTI